LEITIRETTEEPQKESHYCSLACRFRMIDNFFIINVTIQLADVHIFPTTCMSHVRSWSSLSSSSRFLVWPKYQKNYQQVHSTMKQEARKKMSYDAIWISRATKQR